MILKHLQKIDIQTMELLDNMEVITPISYNQGCVVISGYVELEIVVLNIDIFKEKLLSLKPCVIQNDLLNIITLVYSMNDYNKIKEVTLILSTD